MDAVQFYDRTGKVLVEYLVRDVPKRVFSSVDTAQNGVAELSSSQLVLWHNLQHLTLCVVFGSAESPLRVENFVEFLLNVLEKYLPSLSLAQVEQNSSQVLSILDTVLDNGQQVIDEVSIACALVPGPTPAPEIEYDSWRIKGPKHSSQELYIDVEESLAVEKTSSNRGKPLLCRASGSINVLSKLSDEGFSLPRVTIDFILENAQFNLHKCIESKLPQLVFTPADGPSRIAQYTKNLGNFDLVNCRLTTGLGIDKNEFEVHVMVSMDTVIKSIDNLKVRIIAPGAKSIKENRLTAGEVSNDHKNPGEFLWAFGDSIPVGWEATLRGVTLGASFPTYLHSTFDLMGRVPSRAEVKSVQVPGRKVYKGVRYRTSVDLVVRP